MAKITNSALVGFILLALALYILIFRLNILKRVK